MARSARTSSRIAVTGSAALLLLIACASTTDSPDTITVRGDTSSLTLSPLPCETGVDGATPCQGAAATSLPELGSVGTLRVTHWPGGDRPIAAFLEPSPCARTRTGSAQADGEGTWEIEPPGPPARYRVVLVAPNDRFYSFTIVSTRQGPERPPAAVTNLWTMTNGSLDEPLSLTLTNLAPYQAVAGTATITSSDGHIHTVDLQNQGCGADGEARLTSAGGSWTSIGAIGPGPYRVAYRLVIDGTTYRSSLTIDDGALSERLEFAPPLPGLAR